MGSGPQFENTLHIMRILTGSLNSYPSAAAAPGSAGSIGLASGLGGSGAGAGAGAGADAGAGAGTGS